MRIEHRNNLAYERTEMNECKNDAKSVRRVKRIWEREEKKSPMVLRWWKPWYNQIGFPSSVEITFLNGDWLRAPSSIAWINVDKQNEEKKNSSTNNNSWMQTVQNYNLARVRGKIRRCITTTDCWFFIVFFFLTSFTCLDYGMHYSILKISRKGFQNKRPRTVILWRTYFSSQ